MKYQTPSGRLINLSRKKIGRGGEGEVLPVAGAPNLVAKIYHKPTPELRSKVEVMIAHPMAQTGGHTWVTWPAQILFTARARPQFAGYIMPRITDAWPIFIWYNAATRAAKCPDIDFRHLVRCARNLAAAFSIAHGHGYVIGDVNESNVFVGRDARVTLIDADSWQIFDAARRRTYRSQVAKADFLPPELQGQCLSAVDRQTCHDSFALAVLIFKLLNEGTHPFDGVYQGHGEPLPLEARIAAGEFPYLDRSGNWTPKGLAPPFDALHPKLQSLFVQAFQDGHRTPESRPDASTWLQALRESEGDFQVCPQNSSHWHWGSDCHWCQRTILLGGLDLFPEPIRPATTRTTQVPAVAQVAPMDQAAPAAQVAPHEPEPRQIELIAVLIIFLLIATKIFLLLVEMTIFRWAIIAALIFAFITLILKIKTKP